MGEATTLATIRRDSAEEGMMGGHEESYHKVPGVHSGVTNGEISIAPLAARERANPAAFIRPSFCPCFFHLVYFWTGRATRREGKGRRGRETRRDPGNARGLVHCSVVSSCEFCGPRTKQHPRVYCSAPLMYLTRKRRTITSRGFVIIFYYYST